MDLPQNQKTPRIQSLQLVDQIGFADLGPLLVRTCGGAKITRAGPEVAAHLSTNL